jgi:hypothetical protein
MKKLLIVVVGVVMCSQLAFAEVNLVMWQHQAGEAETNYYLERSTLPDVISDELLARCLKEEFTLSSYSMVGPPPVGPFTLHGNRRVLPLDYPVQPYANQLVIWKEQPYLIGTVWNDEVGRKTAHDAGEKTAHQDFICEPIPVEFTDEGIKARG